jgi:uncharacterized protein YqeY
MTDSRRPSDREPAMLRAQFTQAMKDAMKAKDERGLATVRLILAALKDRDIAARGKGNPDGIPEDEILALLQGMVKQRRESIALYSQGNRPDLVAQEEGEIAVIERFLPQQMSEEATAIAIGAVVVELGATGIKDMGRVMAELKSRYAGRMDFAKVGPQVKARLG